eukprot:765308-Hanusia_phi.AAC.2
MICISSDLHTRPVRLSSLNRTFGSVTVSAGDSIGLPSPGASGGAPLGRARLPGPGTRTWHHGLSEPSDGRTGSFYAMLGNGRYGEGRREGGGGDVGNRSKEEEAKDQYGETE